MYSLYNDHTEAQPPCPAVPRTLECAIGARLRQHYGNDMPLPLPMETLLDRLSAAEAAGQATPTRER